jgi:competence protein CoiA
MLTSLRESTGVRIDAKNSERSDAPFLCPACRKIVVLKKGRIVSAHFAHKPPVTCAYGTGESELHRQCKREIYEGLKVLPNVTNCELEVHLGTVIPDIFCVINGVEVAIEVQKSDLTVSRIIERTEEYAKKKIAVLWIAIDMQRLHKEKFSPRPFEKWLHALYFGKIFYWRPGLGASVLEVQYDSYQIWVEQKDWYDEFGNEQSAGGYHRRSKRWRTPKFGDAAAIESMSDTWRSAWGELPTCRLFTNTPSVRSGISSPFATPLRRSPKV